MGPRPGKPGKHWHHHHRKHWPRWYGVPYYYGPDYYYDDYAYYDDGPAYADDGDAVSRCAARYRSFDPRTGTYNPGGGKPRRICPYLR